MNHINYGHLVQEYEESLINVLRGFRPKYDFLEIWVPDNDLEKSLINLFEAAQSFGENNIAIEFDGPWIAKISEDKLKEIGSMFGRTQVENIEGALFLTVGDEVENSTSKAPTETDEYKLPSEYSGKVDSMLKDLAHQKSLNEEEGHLLVHASDQGKSLFCLIDSATHMIRKTSFSGATSDQDKALLEGLCRVVEGVSIQEAYDHSVIKLEYYFRSEQKKSQVRGIANVFNFPFPFQVLLKMVRDLYSNYCGQIKFEKKDNFFDPPPSKAWREYSSEERQKRLQTGINAYLKSRNLSEVVVSVAEVKKGVKVDVIVEGEIALNDKPALLLNLEKHLKQTLLSQIEIYQAAWKDKNLNRRI